MTALGDVPGYVVSGFVALGGYKFVTSLWTAWSLSRKTESEIAAVDAKLPAEVDSVVVQGAEKAVLAMGQALDAATRRIAQLEADRETDRATIIDLQRRIGEAEAKTATAQRAAAAAQTAAHDAQETVTQLRTELNRVAAERDRRP